MDGSLQLTWNPGGGELRARLELILEYGSTVTVKDFYPPLALQLELSNSSEASARHRTAICHSIGCKKTIGVNLAMMIEVAREVNLQVEPLAMAKELWAVSPIHSLSEFSNPR